MLCSIKTFYSYEKNAWVIPVWKVKKFSRTYHVLWGLCQSSDKQSRTQPWEITKWSVPRQLEKKEIFSKMSETINKETVQEDI